MISSLLPLLIASSMLSPTIERAFDRFESHDLAGAAELLDEAAASDPEYFDRNNLYYLRGRIAESLEDWQGAGEAFGEIRRIRPDARIILTSGYSEERAVWEFLDEGRDFFLHKPFEPMELVDRIRRILEGN